MGRGRKGRDKPIPRHEGVGGRRLGWECYLRENSRYNKPLMKTSSILLSDLGSKMRKGGESTFPNLELVSSPIKAKRKVEKINV